MPLHNDKRALGSYVMYHASERARLLIHSLFLFLCAKNKTFPPLCTLCTLNMNTGSAGPYFEYVSDGRKSETEIVVRVTVHVL